MKFVPNYTLNFIEDADFDRRMAGICQALDDCRVSGYFTGFGNIRIFYEYFLAENSRGSVVMLHGMSEFTRKHYELAYYLLQQGYSVFLYDQRGHGRSERLTDQLDLIHVDRFSDFVEDLQLFLQNIVYCLFSMLIERWHFYRSNICIVICFFGISHCRL